MTEVRLPRASVWRLALLRLGRWLMTPLRAPRIALLVLALGLPLARADLPTLGDGSDISLAVERKLGDSIAREIYRDPDYIDDPLLDDYVQGIWDRLHAASRARGEMSPEMDEQFAWTLLLNRDASINAFALPGGYMGVNTGLIALVGSRDELASVLGHELSHITQRHIARMEAKQSQQMPLVVAALVLGMLAATKNPDIGSALIVGGQGYAMQTQLAYSRDMEREADRIGFNVMTQAGYQPQAFVTMFEKLQEASRLNDSGEFPYLRNHPLTSERIADMQLRVAEAPKHPVAADAPPDLAQAMMAARARYLSDPGSDQLNNWVREADAVPPGPTLTPRQVGVSYQAVLAALKLQDAAKARTLWFRLRHGVGADAQALRLVRLLGVELALKTQDLRQALELIDWSAIDRPEMLLQAQVAVAQHKAALAQGGEASRNADSLAHVAAVMQRLRLWVVDHARDGGAWQQIANLAQAQGLGLQALRAEAEVQVANQDLPGAVDRFKAAQDFGRKNHLGNQAGDYIEASIIDTRLRQVEATVKELAKEKMLQR